MEGAQSETVPSVARLPARERSERLSRSLSEAARRLRFSKGSRSYSPISYRARRSRLIYRLIIIVSFFATVAIPSSVAAIYFGLFASNQYLAEARFAVRGGAMAGLDAMTSLTGIPSVQIIQDTQVVTNFVQSRAMVEQLQDKVGLRDLYGRQDADWWARMDPSEPIEDIVKYWNKRNAVSIEMPGGIVHFTVRAFRREDAVAIVNAVLDGSEQLVNQMNDRSRQDALQNATNELNYAADRLAKVRAALEVARNREGMLDAASEALKTDTLLTGLRTRLLELRQQYEVTSRSVSPEAPQLRSLRASIQATEQQIAALQAELTQKGGPPGKGTTVLSASITRLAALELDRTVAETQYASAASALERARIATGTKQIYLTTFVKPVLAEESRYPRRMTSMAWIIGLGLLCWAFWWGVATYLRSRMG